MALNHGAGDRPRLGAEVAQDIFHLHITGIVAGAMHGERCEGSEDICSAPMARGISLANKCQLLFGAAVLTILTVALAVPWARVSDIVSESQLEVSRQLAQTWVADGFALKHSEGAPIPMRVVRVTDGEAIAGADPFTQLAVRAFLADLQQEEEFEVSEADGVAVYRYARALRETQWRAIQDSQFVDFSPRAVEPAIDNPLRAVLVIERSSAVAAEQIAANRTAIAISAAVAVLAAVLTFHLILTKLIFSPVRRLRGAAEKVQKGDLAVRSALKTGDELEELSRAFDGMLGQLVGSQAELTRLNQSLDLKVNELAEANVGLFESNRLKSEFLANISHELRTPLNSIIGFAELLDELARNDPAADPKRLRYIGNILTPGRLLLEMINELLDMAKIEAGRFEVVIAPTSIRDLVEGIQGIMRPQALAKQLNLEAEIAADVPPVETDAGKLQQILHNYLSNAIKFSPDGGTVRIAAHLNGARVRIDVIDQGPGVPWDMQESIFEKFRQVDASHTRRHAGTGLGLAICRELAEMLGAKLALNSTPGKGATFSVELPVIHRPSDLPPLLGPTVGGR